MISKEADDVKNVFLISELTYFENLNFLQIFKIEYSLNNSAFFHMVAFHLS